MEKRFKLKEEVKVIWKQEEIYWGTRAKLNWLKWGDKNTKYFHTLAMQRREINTIHRIKNRNRDSIEDSEETMQNFKETYEDLFKGSDGEDEEHVIQHISRLVTSEDNSRLLKEIHQDEEKATIFHLELT